jgi:glutathione peroxidase-family protein
MKQLNKINRVIKWNLEKFIVQIAKKYLDDTTSNSIMMEKLVS